MSRCFLIRPLVLESWTGNLKAAQIYARLKREKKDQKWSVILRVEKPRGAKDITPLVRHLETEIAKLKSHTVAQDAEWLYGLGARFKVVSIKRDAEKRLVNIELKEVKR